MPRELHTRELIKAKGWRATMVKGEPTTLDPARRKRRSAHTSPSCT